MLSLWGIEVTQLQTQKSLYVVAFFAALSLISIVLTTSYTWEWFFLFPSQAIGSVIGDIFIIILIVAPFKKNNKLLFVVIPLAFMMSFFGLIHDIYKDFVDPNFYLGAQGIVPGLFTWLAYALMNFFGLLFLGLRIYGYIREYRAGLKTQF